MKSLLLFLAGVLVGANVVYFMMVRDRHEPVAVQQVAPVAAPAPATPAGGVGQPPAGRKATVPPAAVPAPAPEPPASSGGISAVTPAALAQLSASGLLL